MKKVAFLLFSFLVICFAEGPKAKQTKGTYHAASKSYGRAEYYAFENDMASYMIYFQWINASAKSSEKVVIGMPQPVFRQGFVNRDFMHLTVNDIDSRILQPKSFDLYEAEGRAGLKVKYNFDGVVMILDFYMTADSQLLFMEWNVDETNEEPIEKIKMNITTYPSYSTPNGGKVSPDYGRKIKTPTREIGQFANGKPGWAYLKKEDTQLTMYDEKFDYPATQKAHGPCYMTLDWTNVLSGRVWFGNIYCDNFEFVFSPAAKQWRFGLWECKKKQSNKEFFDFKAAHEQYFLLK
ncbi:MAG: hypothetical protein J5746_03420 [Victivallales bacterium]|nr:hypothetical protein [Victivallales bacterium]